MFTIMEGPEGGGGSNPISQSIFVHNPIPSLENPIPSLLFFKNPILCHFILFLQTNLVFCFILVILSTL